MYVCQAFVTQWTLPNIVINVRNRALEKTTVLHIVKKSYAFSGTRIFIIASIRARHLSLSRARTIQSTPPTLSRFFKVYYDTVLSTFWSSILSLSLRFDGTMARSQVVVREVLQMWRVAVNVSNDQSRKGDKGWSSRFGGGRTAITVHPEMSNTTFL